MEKGTLGKKFGRWAVLSLVLVIFWGGGGGEGWALVLGPQPGKEAPAGEIRVVVGAIRQELGLSPLPAPEEKVDQVEKKEGENQKEKGKEEEVKEEISKKETPVGPVEKRPPPPVKGKAQEKMAEILEKNREILRQRREQEKQENQEKLKEKEQETSPNGLSFVEKMKEKQKKTYQKWGEETQETRKKWRETLEKTYARWKEERGKFLKRIPEYKANLIEIPKDDGAPPPPQAEAPRSSSAPPPNPSLAMGMEGHIVLGAHLPVRDQGRRPTCSAFAGIRAIEILLHQTQRSWDLSEQYFYWASKPQCQSQPCTVKGSWVKEGLQFGQGRKNLDIPLEGSCPYQASSQPQNETQIPLSSSCQEGKVKVVQYKLLHTLEDVVAALEENSPVVAGLTLSENFFKNQGLVTSADAGPVPVNKEHAQGHALLLVGHMKLPSHLRLKEGERCFLAANSWGEGWGKGGHACLTERWVTRFRFPTPFVAVTSVEVSDER